MVIIFFVGHFQLMESPKRNPEYEAMLKCTDGLATTIKHCIEDCTSKCLSKGLISEEVAEFTAPSKEKARKLVACVRDGIKAHPNHFNTFVDVMMEIRYLEIQAETLQKERGIVVA